LQFEEAAASTGTRLGNGAAGFVGVGNVSRLASVHYNPLPFSHCHWLECQLSLPMGSFHHGCQYSLSTFIYFTLYSICLGILSINSFEYLSDI